jgi:hypothetical protein
MGRFGYGIVREIYDRPQKGVMRQLGRQETGCRTAREKSHTTTDSDRSDDAHDLGGELGVFVLRGLEGRTDPVDKG